jgi:hypothetical protein
MVLPPGGLSGEDLRLLRLELLREDACRLELSELLELGELIVGDLPRT